MVGCIVGGGGLAEGEEGSRQRTLGLFGALVGLVCGVLDQGVLRGRSLGLGVVYVKGGESVGCAGPPVLGCRRDGGWTDGCRRFNNEDILVGAAAAAAALVDGASAILKYVFRGGVGRVLEQQRRD